MSTASHRIELARTMARSKHARRASSLDLYPGLLQVIRIALSNSRDGRWLARNSPSNPESPMR